MSIHAGSARRSVTVASVALCAAFAGTSTAQAADVQLSGGSSRLTQTQATQKVLKRSKVVMRAARPATRSGTRVTLPITSGSVNAANRSGRANHSGRIAFGRGKRSGSITGLTLRLGNDGVITARIRGQRMTFLTLNSRNAKYAQSGLDLTVSNMTGRLSSKAAAAMNRTLKTKAFKRGLAMTVAVTGKPKSVPISSGSASVPLAQPFLQQLASQGAQVTPAGPATVSNNTITLPVVGGSLPPVVNVNGGLLNLSGALNITKGDINFPLSNVVLDFSRNTLNVTGPINFPLANLTGTFAPVINAANGSFNFSNIGLTLSPQASAALSQVGINIAPNTVITTATTITAIAKSLID